MANRTNLTTLRVISVFLVVLAVTGTASADQWAITVPDAGFDDHVLNYVGDWIYISDGSYTGAWKSAGGDAWVDYGYYAGDGDLPALSGNNKLYPYESDPDYVYQILDETFIEGGTYTLSVWVGIAWSGYARGWSLYFTGEDYENNLIEASGNAPVGSWQQVSLVYTATAADARKKIGIKMTGAVYVTFEDVTLSYDGPPRPPIATNPTPADGGGVYDDYVWLEWTAGETAAEHDVYLGTDEAAVAAATPASPEFQANLPLGTESYIVTGLVPGTTYYWRIDEVEAGGSPVWKGRVWSFSVLPYEARNPSPADGARFVDPNADLSWSGGFKASMHEVFFGTDPCSLASIYKSGPSTCDPGSLLYDTTYYWRVTELRMEGPTLIEAPGPIWSFTTGSRRVGELRIIAWNIEFLGIREPLRTQEQLDAIAERILGFDAAVLALQERADVSTSEYIRSQLGPSWKIYPYSDNWNALLYDENKVEMLSVELLNTLNSPPYTPYPSGRPRPVSGVFRPAGTQGTELFRVIGVHCSPWGSTERAAEGEWLRKKIVEFLNDPRETNDIILLGDLNGEPPGGAPHPQLQQGGYIYLLPKENGDSTSVWGGRIDHFYVTETARDKVPKESSFVIRPEHYGETPWEFKGTYSDHYPIFIDIDFVWSSAGAGRPIPADGAFGLSTDVVLRWTAGTKAESHDVYFGTDEAAVVAATPSSPEFKANQTDTTYPLAELEMETTYYWRIDEVNDADTWTGDIWSFTTGKVYYVDGDAEGANDGSNWADGFNDLQDALATAQYGDEVRVAQGVYKPAEPAPPPPPPPASLSPVITTSSASTGDREATFQLKNGVIIKGGYAGYGEPDPDARDIELYETILSGDLNGNDGPDFANNGENSYHVVTSSGTNATAVLDGFTITAGNANGSGSRRIGGGMYNYFGSPTLADCTFSGNSASYDGGGMFNSSGSPTLTNCTFIGNSAEGYAGGGGMYNEENSRPVLTNCTFIGNSAGGEGGGMDNYESSPTLTNCTFSENSAGDNSGGMNNKEHSNPTLTNCTFSDNSAEWNGGGMSNDSSSPMLTNCTFSGNWAGSSGGGMINGESSPKVTNCTFTGNSAEWGGGMHNHYSHPTLTSCTFNCNSASGGGGMCNVEYSSPTLTNCTFTGNSAEEYGGGGMYNESSSPTLTNCTFGGNSSAGWSGGGMSNFWVSSPTLTNCILWGNTAPSGSQIYNDGTSSATVSYSDVQGGWPGEGNIDADPCFVGLKIGEPPEDAIAHWKLDEGEGTIAYDSAGENDGTIYGAQWTTGQLDGALSFDGHDDYVSAGAIPELRTTDSFTWSFWVNLESGNGSTDIIVGNRAQTTGFHFIKFTPTAFEYYNYGHDGTINYTVSTERWVHLAVVKDGPSLTYYSDAEVVGTGVVTQDMSSNPLYFAGDPGYGEYAACRIDDVRIYDRALSAEEVQQFYQVDYHLLPDSPCIDAGTNTPPGGLPPTDIEGNPRPFDGDRDGIPIADMGAYEYSNTAPAACIVGGDRTIEATSLETRVTLDGSCSSDVDSAPGTNDDIVSFDWYKVDACDPNFEDFLASGEIIDCNLPLGEHIIVLEAIDKAGAFDTNEVTIIVQDTTLPEFTLSVTPTMLWPTNHKMVLIRPSWTASDICDASPEVSLVSITMNEGDEAKGDGHTTLNIQIGGDGSIYLRAERSGTGSGRIYTITYQAVDDSGNTAVASATVTVPHDQR